MGEINSESICLNSGDLIETDDELIVQNCAVMHAGVYNGKLKPPDELKASTRWWLGTEIVIQSESEIGDHPKDGITTAQTIRVGQLLNPTWDASNLRINAEAHFIKELTPDWLQADIRARKVLGVSGAYFTTFIQENGELDGKKYNAIETNFVPNNLAIVANPACKAPECGININKEIIITNDKKITEAVNNQFTATINSQKTEEKTMVDIETVTKDKYDALGIQINTLNEQVKTRDQELVTVKAENIKLNSALESATKKLQEIELGAKKAAFLSQFPEENRELAEKELLTTFLERPADLMINSAKRYVELMSPAKKEESKGTEFVSLNEDEFSVNADYVMNLMGLKKKA